MKNTFKRIFALLLALVMVLSMAACGSEEKPAADDKQPAVEGGNEGGEVMEEAGKITILYPGEETPASRNSWRTNSQQRLRKTSVWKSK